MTANAIFPSLNVHVYDLADNQSADNNHCARGVKKLQSKSFFQSKLISSGFTR